MQKSWQNCFCFANPYINLPGPPFVSREYHPEALELLLLQVFHEKKLALIIDGKHTALNILT